MVNAIFFFLRFNLHLEYFPIIGNEMSSTMVTPAFCKISISLFLLLFLAYKPPNSIFARVQLVLIRGQNKAVLGSLMPF